MQIFIIHLLAFSPQFFFFLNDKNTKLVIGLGSFNRKLLFHNDYELKKKKRYIYISTPNRRIVIYKLSFFIIIQSFYK